MRSIDSIELTLDEWSQIVNEMDAKDEWCPAWHRFEVGLIDAPFVELLNLDIEASIRILSRNNAVNGRVGESCL